jgi:hypothetical protein
MGQAQWNKSQKHFVTSLDFGLTEPRALAFLASLPGSHLNIANPGILNTHTLMPGKAYHPKLYLFDTPKVTGYLVGSANLAKSALISNTEVVAVGKEMPANGRWDAVWTELMRDTTAFSWSLFRRYQRKRGRLRERLVQPDPVPSPPVIQPRDKPVFGDVINAGVIDPMAFDQLWVQAGTMPSGGSHNQLELPRGANRFFGFMHASYGDAHVTIGRPQLTARGIIFANRPLTWHGHNKMERINLPTVAQGGFDYRNKAVLFRRHPAGFEINVLPWNDESALAWRAASDALGTIFRLGERGSRLCGLF